MNNPKDEARSMVDKFINFADPGKTDSYIVKRANARRSALCCVNEILNVLVGFPMDVDYWLLVREEIEKL